MRPLSCNLIKWNCGKCSLHILRVPWRRPMYLVRKCFDLDTVKVMIKFFLIFFSSWNYHYQYLIYSTVCSEQKLLKKLVTFFCLSTSTLESVQDFLIKLGIKPLMHLLEISTFSPNNVIVRRTKIMNRADKIGYIFSKSFQKISLL